MYLVLWQYIVDLTRVAQFEQTYGPQGDWAALFRRAEGYLGTSLLREIGGPPVYLTVDRWRNAAAYQAFLADWQSDYQALEGRSRSLGVREVRLGTIETDDEAWMG